MDYAMSPPGYPAVPAPTSIGGFLTIQSASSMAQEQRRADEDRLAAEQAQPHIQGLAGHIRSFWTTARDARSSVDSAMLEAVRSRRGQYPPAKEAELLAQGTPLIYMMLFSTKCRAASSLLRDALVGTGSEKPWTLTPTADPDLDEESVQGLLAQVAGEVQQAQALGLYVTPEQIKQRLIEARQQMDNLVREEAARRMETMEIKMEDQLQEGEFLEALDQFIDDLPTFKCAFIKGPVVRRKPALSWVQGELVVEDKLALHWERVDPFDMYPAPWAKGINDAPLIQRHRLSRRALNDMLGVQGYSDTAIRKVLEEYGRQGLHEWLGIDGAKADAEGRDANSGDLIDALQYWGSVSGQMLREWGMTPEQVPDEAKEYEVEAWLIGNYVIKAVLNPDPLARRPYFKMSYETVPGTFWGNSLYDLIRDCQEMCNAAARALVGNMGMSSGPQVYVNVSRLPLGEDITTMYPWKIWQVTSDPTGSSADPIRFFQPTSNAAELMGIYEKFSTMADEYSGIPRYMTGTEGTPGAGRTASGLSMMITNASKIIKQLIAGIDVRVIKPLLERLYFYNMQYGDDPDLKGDIRVVARGALSLVTKESAQVRLNEFMAATGNPIDMQIIGLEGRAEMMRRTLKTLDVNPDKVVPPASVLRERQMMAQIQQAQMMQQQAIQAQPSPAGASEPLMDGAPATDHFQPRPQP